MKGNIVAFEQQWTLFFTPILGTDQFPFWEVFNKLFIKNNETICRLSVGPPFYYMKNLTLLTSICRIPFISSPLPLYDALETGTWFIYATLRYLLKVQQFVSFWNKANFCSVIFICNMTTVKGGVLSNAHEKMHTGQVAKFSDRRLDNASVLNPSRPQV